MTDVADLLARLMKHRTSRRRLLGAAIGAGTAQVVSAGGTRALDVVSLAFGDDGYPNPERGPILPENLQYRQPQGGDGPSALPGLSRDAPSRLHLPALAADRDFPPPPPPPAPASGRPTWSGDALLNVMYRADTDKPLAALTIDDGAASLDDTLKVIRDEGAGATFFLTGKYLDRKKDFLQRAVETPGVEIANHTWNHSDLSALSDDRIREELTRFEAMLADEAPETVDRLAEAIDDAAQPRRPDHQRTLTRRRQHARTGGEPFDTLERHQE